MITNIQREFNNSMKSSFDLLSFLKSSLNEYYNKIINEENSYIESIECLIYNINKPYLYRNKHSNLMGRNIKDLNEYKYKLDSIVYLLYNKDNYENIKYKGLYKKIFIDSINFIRFFYMSLRKYIANTLNIDLAMYNISFYKTYNFTNDYTAYFINRYNRDGKLLFHDIFSNHEYEPFISIGYYDDYRNGNIIYNINMYSFDGTEYNSYKYIPLYCDGIDIYYRTLIFPFSDKIIINDCKSNDSFTSLYNNLYPNFYNTITPYDDMKNYIEIVNSMYTDNNKIDDNIVTYGVPSPIQFNNHIKNIAPKYISFYNLISYLSIAIINKSDNKFIMILDSNNENYKLKVVNECTGFNEVIYFKREHNSKVSSDSINNIDELNKYNKLNDGVDKLLIKRNKYIHNKFKELDKILRDESMDKLLNLFRNNGTYNKDFILSSSCTSNLKNINDNNINSLFIKISLDYYYYAVLLKYYPDLEFKHIPSKFLTNFIFSMIIDLNNDDISSIHISNRLFYYLFKSKELKSKYDKALERVEYLRMINGIFSSLNILEEDNKILYKDNELIHFVEFLIDLYKDLKDKALNYLHDSNTFDIEKIKKYNSDINSYNYKKKKIMNNYKLGAKEKKIMRNIRDIDDYKDILMEANFWIGNGLYLQSKKIDI